MHRTGYSFYTFTKRFDLDATSRMLSNPDIITHPMLAMNFLVNYLAYDFIFGRETELGVAHRNRDVCAFEAWTWASYLFYMWSCNKEFRAALGFPPDEESTQPPRQKTFDLAIVQGLANIDDFTGWQSAPLWQKRFWSYMEASKGQQMGEEANLFDYNIWASVDCVTPLEDYNTVKDRRSFMLRGVSGLEDQKAFVDDNFGTMIKLLSLPEGCAETYDRVCRELGWDRF